MSAAPSPDEVRRTVLRHLTEAAEPEVAAEEIADGDSLRDDLGLGSLDAMLLVLELEEQLGIDVEDDELASLDTVGTLMEMVATKLRGGGPTPV